MKTSDDMAQLQERVAMLEFLAFSEDTVEVEGAPPQTAWAVSLRIVVDDVLGGDVVCGTITPKLVEWCAAREKPEHGALALASLAVYAAPSRGEVIDALTAFTGLPLDRDPQMKLGL